MRVLIIAVLALIGYVQCNAYKYPYLVSIEYKSLVAKEVVSEHICSGAIISEKLILTLASCIRGYNVDDLRVRAASATIGRDGLVKSVEKVVPHERYMTSRKDYDIAVVHIRVPFTFDEDIKAVNLPTGKEAPSVGSHATLIGWGVTDGSDLLEAVDMEMSVPIQCKNLYAPSIIYITERMFCAGNRVGRTSCRTDPGSLLVTGNTLLGLSAFELKCGRYPGIYTNIANYKKWISL